MEYCGGGSVSDLIQANLNAPLDEEVIAFICRETLAGLAYLHSIGKVPITSDLTLSQLDSLLFCVSLHIVQAITAK